MVGGLGGTKGGTLGRGEAVHTVLWLSSTAVSPLWNLRMPLQKVGWM